MAASSGLAATSLIVNLLKAGDHILCCDDVYGGLSVCLNVYYEACPVSVIVCFLLSLFVSVPFCLKT